MADVLRADGLVVAENLKGSALPAEDLEAGSTGVRTLPLASNKVYSQRCRKVVAFGCFRNPSTETLLLSIASSWIFV